MTLAVLRKELAVLWSSSLPYVVGAAFHAVLGVLAVNQLEVRGQAVIQPLFPIAGFLMLFTLPVLTMRSFADEARSGTLDQLLAIPVPPRPLVLGKWLAAWLSSLIVLAPALLIAVLLAQWGDPDPGPVVSGFLGLALLAGALGGVGVLASALTSSQPVAAMIGVFAVLVLWFAHTGTAAIEAGGLIAAVSLSERLRTFAGGAIDTADVAFFVTMAAACLVATSLAIDLRRWR
ncbi:MAG TPA: ABC transporter permease subunit [Acidimicrobiales bacterium]|nr:ABC transporter permease subunit [Acidimicrobiales bacterium]